jgi:hypothetical protein
MQKVYTLTVYSVDVQESNRDKSVLVVQFEGDLKPKTKKELVQILGPHVAIRCNKKVLA